ncbi:hypothetical protein G6F43_013468 [Rhizopus delemar]|nr:hypothetical protein G6F43_013468 [Rhizopus delemar]
MLFNLAFEPLLRKILNDPLYNGFSTPRAPPSCISDNLLQPIKLLAYADDVLCLLKDPSDLSRLQTHLDTYSQASNAKVNFHKTEALSLSGSRITSSSIWHGPLLSHRISRWHDCHSANPVIYLGYPLYTSTAQRDSYLAGLLRKINTACVLHSHRSLSVRGRATIVNSLILSKLWHVLRVTSVPRAFLEKVKSAVGAFLTRRMFPRISMATLCLPRTLGGLGVLDPVTQQSALQLRWILPLLSLSPPSISSDDDSSIALSQSIVLPSLIQYLLFHLDQWVKRPRTVYSFDFSKFDLRLCFLFVDLRPPVLRVHDGVFSLLFRCMDLLPKDFSDTVINHETSLQLKQDCRVPLPTNLILLHDV